MSSLYIWWSYTQLITLCVTWYFSRYWIYEAVTDRILFIDLWFSLSFSTGLFEEIVSDSTLYATSTCLGNRVRARYRASRWSRTKVLPLRLLSQVLHPSGFYGPAGFEMFVAAVFPLYLGRSSLLSSSTPLKPLTKLLSSRSISLRPLLDLRPRLTPIKHMCQKPRAISRSLWSSESYQPFHVLFVRVSSLPPFRCPSAFTTGIFPTVKYRHCKLSQSDIVTSHC